MRTLFLGTLCLLFLIRFGFSQQTTILYDHGEYGFDYSDIEQIKWQYERQYQLAIGQAEDANLLRNVSIEIDRQTGDELVDAQVLVKRPGGSADTLTRDSFKLQPYDAVFAEYLCMLPGLRVGDTISVSYRIHSKPGTDITRWSIQHAYPVKSSIFEFMVPEGCIYHDHITQSTYLFREEAIDTTYVVGRSRIPSKGLRLTFQDIPAYIEEPLAPDLSVSRPAVLFAISDLVMGDVQLYMPTWANQVTDLVVSDYFGKQYRVRPAYKWLSDRAAAILETRYTPRLMVLKLYELVHELFSWDGTYGLIPSHSIADMEENRVVNKASMNMALLALLQEAGMKAYPVLVSTVDQPLVYSEIPNLNQFNHFLIMVEDGKEIIYLDAGDPLLPTGLTDNAVRHSPVILIKNYKGTWTEIPDFEAKSTILINMQVHNDLSASGVISASFEGYDAQNERHFLRADPQALYWKERGLAMSPDIRIDSVRFEHVRNLLEPFINKVYFHIQPSADQEELAFSPVFYSFFNQSYFADTLRVNKVVFPSILREQVIFNLNFDGDIRVISMPGELRLRMEDHSSEMEFRQTQQTNRLQCTFTAAVLKTVIDPLLYPALRAYFQQLDTKLSERLVIGRK
jgi:hypothetical protein